MFALLLTLASGMGLAAAGAGGGGSEKSKETVAKTPPTEPPAPSAPPANEMPMPEEPDDEHGSGHEMPEEPDDEHGSGHEMPEEPDDEHGSGHEMPEEPDDEHGSGHEMPEEPDDEHGSGHEMPEEPENEHGSGHEGHGGHGSGHTIPLPTTPAEIEAFVAAVKASPEMHAHEMGSSMAGEHMAAMELVSRDEATHIAIGNGDWNDPSNWYNGEIPGDDAKVLIPEGVDMTYSGVNEARLFTLRVDGHLDFDEDVDSRVVVDTLVVSPSGTLTIGTAENPIDPDVNVEIIFANNGAIDTDWDPLLLSRGMVAHGTVEIHGAEKDSHDKVIEDPMAGDTWIDFEEAPEGWAVGDTIVIAGTHYEGYYNIWNPEAGYQPPEDEERVITDIDGGRIFFNEPLEFDHDAPREDLKTSVANYTRNISFETENAETAEVFERGHVMFMHNDDVDVRYAEFHELGRTDKSEDARNTSEFEEIEFDSNVKGRYSFHFHRAGVDGEGDPGMSVGNSVYGSPGWGFVHHDSHAIFDNNASYDTFGAGYVAESGNETGAWTDNIAIFAQGVDWMPPKFSNDVDNFDLGRTGDGFWFQSRMVESVDNIAASVNNGFVYFHRGGTSETENIRFDSEVTDIGGILKNSNSVTPDDHPILSFSGNEVFAAKGGIHVVKGNPNQGHDVHSVMEDFTAWSVRQGANFEYTSHYTLIDFDIIGKDETELSKAGQVGIQYLNATTDMTIVDSKIANFDTGINLFKLVTGTGDPTDAHDYHVINPTFIDVETEYQNYDPEQDTILTSAEVPYLAPDIQINGPLTFKEFDNGVYDPEARTVEITGTKTDSLGESAFPAGTDDYSLNHFEVRQTMLDHGYYTDSSGQNYFLLDLYFSDRLTGDIYSETHPVLLDDNVPLGRGFWDVPFNGERDLDAQDGLSSDAADLWATLTDGQLVLEDPEEEEEMMHMHMAAE